MFVREVKLIGLEKLERVVIGEFSFAYNYMSDGDYRDRFYLKDCPLIKELKMDRGACYYYSVCEIENMPSLEVIDIGEVNRESGNFHFASLELKSDSQRMK